MRIAIHGVGRLGSTVAFHCMRELSPEEIQLIDIDTQKARGEMIDLQDAARGLKSNTKFTTRNTMVDVSIISAGRPRNHEREDVLEENKIIVRQVMQKVESKNILLLTNPVNELTKWLIDDYGYRKEIYNSEVFLTFMRKKISAGNILETKGFTNWGPAVAAVAAIRFRRWNK